MTREPIPKKIREAVSDEYNHRCAICGSDRPHIHHIDEDATNNTISNLLPLCPNCHLRDQHNPTRKVEISKLKLFREYKDPAILKPQFDPVYKRQLFLDSVEIHKEEDDFLENHAKELIEFVASLEMGNFYSKRIHELIGEPENIVFGILSKSHASHITKQLKNRNAEYRKKLVANSHKVKALLIELLRYQAWANS